MITREALRVLENNLTFTKQINRQYDDKFGVEGAKIGTVLNVRKPPRYLGRTGQALQVEGATETQVPVTLNTQFGVDLQFSSQDLALSIDDFSDRFIKPAIATIANKIDADGLALYTSIYNAIGKPGTTSGTGSIDDLFTYLSAGVRLDNGACPMDGLRSIVLTPFAQASIVNALKTLFQQASAIASQYVKGQMGTAAGFDWYMDQNCATHTTGTIAAASATVNGANQTGSSIATTGWTSGDTLKIGDIVQFAGVYSVNPQSRQSTAILQDFVITADVTTTTTATLSISPSIIVSGANQTVSNSPASGASVQVWGSATTSTYSNKTSPQSMAFHRDAFTLVTADLPLPGGVDMAARVSDKQLGMSIRMIRAYDINTDLFPCRLDILYGWATLRPELACRIAG
jgi:hypothetical protein